MGTKITSVVPSGAGAVGPGTVTLDNVVSFSSTNASFRFNVERDDIDLDTETIDIVGSTAEEQSGEPRLDEIVLEAIEAENLEAAEAYIKEGMLVRGNGILPGTVVKNTTAAFASAAFWKPASYVHNNS